MNYYDTLGVSKTATDDEIKKAFRKMALKYHPDRNKGDKSAEAKFKEINEAYETLKDPQRRAAYDRYGHEGYKNASAGGGFNPGGGFGGAQGFSSRDFHFDFGGSGFSDIFDEFFGGASAGSSTDRSEMRGSDLRYDATISLEDAFNGKTIDLTLRTNVVCDACHGYGTAGGVKPKTCPHCKGTGKMRFSQGFFIVERPCSACNGTGHIIEQACQACKGAGRVNKSRTLSISIPAGVEDGAKIRLAGEGEAGIRGGRSGDLYIFVTVRSHKLFTRDKKNIHCDVPISLVTAALGGEMEVPTIEGKKAIIKIPAGTQSGQVLKLRGKGMPGVRSSLRGDMMIHVNVETPVNLTEHQKELLREFDAEKKSNPKSDSFFSKVKEFWQEL